MWKKNVVRHRNSNCARALEEKLFILNKNMRTTLLEFRAQTHDMQQKLRFIGIDEGEGGGASSIGDTTFTLQAFKEQQERTRKRVNQEIQVYSTKCRDIVKKGFDESLQVLKRNQYMASNEDDFNAAGGGAAGSGAGAGGAGAQKKQA